MFCDYHCYSTVHWVQCVCGSYVKQLFIAIPLWICTEVHLNALDCTYLITDTLRTHMTIVNIVAIRQLIKSYIAVCRAFIKFKRVKCHFSRLTVTVTSTPVLEHSGCTYPRSNISAHQHSSQHDSIVACTSAVVSARQWILLSQHTIKSFELPVFRQ